VRSTRSAGSIGETCELPGWRIPAASDGFPGALDQAKQTMSIIETCVDARGVSHRKADANARIVSLVPSLTELLCDLGLDGQIVGRTGFCVHPRDTVRRIPKVGGTKDVDIEKIRRLTPTHVVVNIDENRRELVESLASFVENIFVTHPLGPDDNEVLYDTMGFLFSRERQAAAIKEKYHAALTRLRSNCGRPHAKVLYLIWRGPWMTIAPDTYISRMLEIINWHSVPDTTSSRYPEIDLADFVGSVDKVLLSSEPFPFSETHIKEIRKIFGSNTDVRLVDGEMLSWYGSRAITGLDYLATLADASCTISA